MTKPSARSLLYHQDNQNSTELALRQLQAQTNVQRADSLVVAQLSDIAGDMGPIRSGRLYSGTVTVDDSTVDTLGYVTFSGSGMVRDGAGLLIHVGSSTVTASDVAVSSGTVTYYVNATDGKLYTGAGAVVLDASGISLAVGAAAYNVLKWVSGATVASQIGATFTSNVISGMDVAINRPGTEQCYYLLNVGRASLAIYDDTVGNRLNFEDQFGNFNWVQYGDEADYLLVAVADAGAKTPYTHTIKAGSMGAYGSFEVHAYYLVSNTGATSVTGVFGVTFGGTTLFANYSSAATGTSTPRYAVVHLKIKVTNVASVSAQECEISFTQGAAVADTTGAPGGAGVFAGLKKAAVNTDSGDRDFVITANLSTATNSKLEQLGVLMFGPYYSAG